MHIVNRNDTENDFVISSHGVVHDAPPKTMVMTSARDAFTTTRRIAVVRSFMLRVYWSSLSVLGGGELRFEHPRNLQGRGREAAADRHSAMKSSVILDGDLRHGQCR